MSYYPPPGSYQSFYTGTPQTVVYPGTPIPASNFLAPQQQAPNVIYVPSRSSSRNTHRHGHDRGHGRSRSRERRHGRSHSYERKHSDHRHSSKHKHGHRRHASEGHKRHRSHRDHDYVPRTAPSPGPIPYRPTWTQRLRQFFGLAPPAHKHRSETHSWGLFRPKRQRYVDAYTGAEVDMYGRPVYRV